MYNVQCAVSAVQKTVPRPTPVAEVLDLHYTITFKEEQKETFFFPPFQHNVWNHNNNCHYRPEIINSGLKLAISLLYLPMEIT